MKKKIFISTISVAVIAIIVLIAINNTPEKVAARKAEKAFREAEELFSSRSEECRSASQSLQISIKNAESLLSKTASEQLTDPSLLNNLQEVVEKAKTHPQYAIPAIAETTEQINEQNAALQSEIEATESLESDLDFCTAEVNSSIREKEEADNPPVADEKPVNQNTKSYIVPNRFSIEGKWKSVGEYGFGQAQPGAIVVFNGTNCNFFSPKDTYAVYKENGQYKLDCTSFMSTGTVSFVINIIDNDHIDIAYGDSITELVRV